MKHLRLRLRRLSGSLTLLGLSVVSPCALAVDDEADLASSLGDPVATQGPDVSIVTGRTQPLRRAPAVATVITAEDIARTGATDLDDVMEGVPGVHVSRNVQGYNPLYLFRGIHSQFNAQALMLLDGMPLTMLFIGNRGNAWGGMPLENIERIEVIRGPGSALFGADAYAGVINLITKASRDIDGTEVGLRAGSHQSHHAWALHGGSWGPWNVAAYIRHGHTGSSNRRIEADAQTQIDRLLGTRASLAPGPIRTQHDDLDAQISLNWGATTLRLGHLSRDHIGLGGGAASALDATGFGRTARSYLNLSVRDAPLTTDWHLNAQTSALHFATTYPSPLMLHPPGAWAGAFPDGMRGAPNTWERQLRASATFVYTGRRGHVLSLGLGHEDLDLYKTRELKNFRLPTGGLPQPIGQVVESTPEDAFLSPHKRRVDHVLLQDEWNVARDWTLTTGVRHDHYSDVGGTTNPRIALVWDTHLNLTTKLMHGRAFRAPSFTELHSVNNPILVGNPALKPETIQTTELAFDWQARPDTQLKLSVFRHGLRSLIAPAGTPPVYQNSGRQTGEGFELEARHEVSRDLIASGHLAWQRNRDRASGEDVGYAPRRHTFGRLDWLGERGLTWSGQLNHVAGRPRAPGDARPNTPDHTTFDLTLRIPGPSASWTLSASVRNVFNADVREPSLYLPGDTLPVLIPGDLPLPGRTWHVQWTWRL